MCVGGGGGGGGGGRGELNTSMHQAIYNYTSTRSRK